MNIKEIKEMIQLMNENGLTELEMEKDGLKIRLKKSASGGIEPIVYESRPAVSVAPVPREAVVKGPAAQTSKNTIKSPMVGTFYAAPAPDAPAFVQIGTEVQVGQVVCVLEAMKLMNEIKSEIRGKIIEILVHNGDPVEFGQPLFVLE